jgi:phosphoglycolate phosphatase-like HAD superfamily hydrolase
MAEIYKYPEKETEFRAKHPETREHHITVASDFEDEQGNYPEIEIYPEKGLLLFDIDGTLVNAKEIHGKAIQDLWQEEFGIAIDEEGTEFWFSNFGLGDAEEFRLLLEHSDLQHSDKTITELSTKYGEKMLEILENASDEEKAEIKIPEAEEFLKRAHAIHLPMGIVTGNVKVTTEAMVKHLGWAKYFITGGYNDDPDVSERADILNHTLNKCKAKGVTAPPERIAVIGDTPRDAAAAAKVNPKLREILVATGDHDIEDLEKTHEPVADRKPDLVLKQMTLLDLYDNEQIKNLLGEEAYEDYLKYLKKEARS